MIERGAIPRIDRVRVGRGGPDTQVRSMNSKALGRHDARSSSHSELYVDKYITVFKDDICTQCRMLHRIFQHWETHCSHEEKDTGLDVAWGSPALIA
jgi:hypothetical protein